MTKFDRRLAFPDRLIGPDAPAWVADLLSLWRPAGQDSGELGLRLAVRNGYVNLYRRGQSVARISFDRAGRPRAETHVKYAGGGKEQRYACLDDAAITCGGIEIGRYRGLETLEQWVRRADEHAGREKRFVDEVIAHNPDVIDLEMGLPAATAGDSAPRMDIVQLEAERGARRIVFWEAKVMGDGRLRRRDPAMAPEVVGQLQSYRKWVMRAGHREAIGSAYKRNCELLVGLHRRARSINPAVAGLGPAIIATARSDRLPEVDPEPRLLIDDRGGSASWAPHAAKLAGIAQHYVRCADPRDFRLPTAV